MENGTYVVFALTGLFAGGVAMAECPSTMPEQLLEDCIVYEDAGSTFPTSDYAHMDLYKKWLDEEKRKAELSAKDKVSMQKR